MDSIFEEILDEELNEIILYELYQQNTKGNDFKDAQQIVLSYNLHVEDDRLYRALEVLRKEQFIRRDPSNVNSIALSEKGIKQVVGHIIPKLPLILPLARNRFEALIKSKFDTNEFSIETLGDGFRVSYFPSSRKSEFFFSAFSRRNTYYYFESNPSILLYRRTDGSAIYKAFEKWLTLLNSESVGNRIKDSVYGRPINALSTKIEDSVLISEGLTNHGLLGFLDNSKYRNTFGLQQFLITFPRGLDYFYTIDTTNENFKDRNPKDRGILGYVKRTKDTNYHQLHRFFSDTHQVHLFVTSPNLDVIKLDYNRNESKDNPIFIKTNSDHGELPLYFYSNSNKIFFTPLNADSEESDSFSGTEDEEENFPENYLKDLQDILETSSLNRARFTVRQEGRSSAIVQVLESMLNFYVNLQKNGVYFTVRRNPEPKQGSYIRNDVESWSEVVEEFKSWLQDIPEFLKSNSNEERSSDMSRAEGVLLLEGPTNYQFRNDNVKATLDVTTQAEIFFKLIKSINTTESGSLLGIFGRWGRGKTYFWKQLVKYFDDSKDVNILHLEFHAWKYQDTPASWAYLYELFVKKFYNRTRVICGLKLTRFNISKYLNRVILNFERLGRPRFLTGMVILSFGIIWYYFIDFTTKLGLGLQILSWLGISTIISTAFFYYNYSGLAKDLFKSYLSDVSFKDYLGIQAEIQKELALLVKAWIPDDKVGPNRLVLFVDDIDRCDEKRIIQVIDSLKIMIDDPDIYKRVIVIAAIDETVLKRAVKHKYYGMIERDLSLNKSQRKVELDKLCREYLDKLFINGFKLGNLTSEERIDLFRNLTEEQTFFRNTKKKEEKYSENLIEPETTATVPNNKGKDKVLEEVKDVKNFISLMPAEEFEIMDYELEILLNTVRKYSNSTPRSIRIFYYRYLLAKSFKGIIIKRGTAISDEWDFNQEKKEILPFLIVEYSGIKTHQDLLREIEMMELKSDPQVEIVCLGKAFSLSRSLYLSLLKVVEIVVPY